MTFKEGDFVYCKETNIIGFLRTNKNYDKKYYPLGLSSNQSLKYCTYAVDGSRWLEEESVLFKIQMTYLFKRIISEI